MNQRLKILRIYLKYGIVDFSTLIGVSKSSYDRYEKGISDIPSAVISKIVETFNVDYDWLFNGTGSDLNKPVFKDQSKNDDFGQDLKKIESNAIEIGEINFNLEEPVQGYATNSNGNIFIDIGGGKIQMFIPLVEEYAYGGYLSGYMNQDYLKELPKFSIIVDKHHKGIYRSFQVRGDSMNDNSNESICSGDTAVGRNISKNYWNSRFHLKTWKDFIIVHSGGIIIKRIIEHDVENGTIVCASLNPDKINYPNLILNLEDVYELFNVIEVSRKRK